MTWTPEEMTRLVAAEESQVAARRRDGTLRDPVTIWVIRRGDDVYVRSVNGPAASWFRGTQTHHDGRVRVGGVEKDVSFLDADHRIDDQIDDAYRAECHRYATSIISAITSLTRAPRTRGRLPATAVANDSGETP